MQSGLHPELATQGLQCSYHTTHYAQGPEHTSAHIIRERHNRAHVWKLVSDHRKMPSERQVQSSQEVAVWSFPAPRLWECQNSGGSGGTSQRAVRGPWDGHSEKVGCGGGKGIALGVRKQGATPSWARPVGWAWVSHCICPNSALHPDLGKTSLILLPLHSFPCSKTPSVLSTFASESFSLIL